MRGLSAKETVLTVGDECSTRDSGMFDRAIMCAGTVNEHTNVALRRGSSQHGKQRRASMDSNCVDAISFASPWMFVYVDL